jgi:glycosyltransferase involved in cell wall biosynthesis
MKSRVSIIVTCFNQAHCIAKTLESVALQTYKNWECIIIDDGSTDDSSQIIQDFAKKDTRFIYHYQNNQGVSKARNTGFALAEGEYINFLDGDDTFLPEKLEKQLAVFNKHSDVDICICDHQYYDELKKTYSHYKFEPIQQKPLKQLLYGWHNGVAFPNHAVIYKRDIWSQNEQPFLENYPHRCEDWVFNVLVALKPTNYFFLDEVLCNYHMGSSNFTGNQINLIKAAIKAAYYLNPLIPESYQKNFIDCTIETNLKMYLEKERQNILASSKNWRIANKISKPIFYLLNKIKNFKN